MSNLPQLKLLTQNDHIKESFASLLGDRAAAFVTSVITNVSNSDALQKVNPSSVILCAASAAALNLPISKELGLAALIPRKGVATLQIMVDGWVALAKRGGQLVTLTCEPVYEGELIARDRFRESYSFLDTGCEDESKIIGFMCYMREANGFRKTIYWTKEKMLRHAKKYGGNLGGLWTTDLPSMARKTLIKHMLKKYATLSIEMQTALERDDRILEGDVNNINTSSEPEYPTDETTEDIEAKDIEVPLENTEETKETKKTKKTTKIDIKRAF